MRFQSQFLHPFEAQFSVPKLIKKMDKTLIKRLDWHLRKKKKIKNPNEAKELNLKIYNLNIYL